jgi:hypothetical protein
VDLARLEEKCVTRLATMTLTAVVKLLRAREGYPYQIAIVPVRIKGMPFEMRFNRLNTRIYMLTQFKPVICHTALLLLSALPYYTGYVWKICAFSRRKRTDCRKLKQLNSFSRNNVDDRA